MNTKDRLELAHWVVAAARAEGAAEVAVDITNSREIEIEHRDGQLDKVKESTQNSLSLDVYVEGKYSGHTTNDLRRDSLGRFVSEAVAMTKYLTEDPFRKLPDPEQYQGQQQMDLDLTDGSYDSITADQRVKVARELQLHTSSLSDKIISTTASYNDGQTESVKVLSNGFEGTRNSTTFSAGVEVTIDDGQGGRPSDYDYATTRFLSDIPSLEKLGQSAVDKAVAKIGQTKLESGMYDMVIVNRAASRPLGALRGPMTGRSLQQKRSYLDGKLGQRIASEKLTVIDDPFVKRGLGSRTFDPEGMATRRRVMIDKGILKEYYINCYYARKLGVEPTGGSTTNTVFEYGDKSVDDLVRLMNRGILVTGMIGGNSNSTTGDYSWGIRGALIEDGRPVKPVYEMNISGNLEGLWGNLVEVGNDPFEYSSLRRPSFYFKDVQFSGL
ncbi:MAG: TldD/PmbA family protein [Candidatus Zixiibacteriota bacterium]|nr:MAG: TldD/PmbA family protein [candidate division Zixibacteria bacterium]